MTGSFRNPLGEKGVVYDCTYLKESYQKDGDISIVHRFTKKIFNTHKSFFCNPPMKFGVCFMLDRIIKKLHLHVFLFSQ